jgi:hypothetical protein
MPSPYQVDWKARNRNVSVNEYRFPEDQRLRPGTK